MAACCFIGTHAQETLLNNPDNHGYWGVRASLDISCPGDVKYSGIGTDTYDNGVGFSIGGIYNAPVVANFYIEPGLNLYYNTYSLSKLFKDELKASSASIRKFGMRIPVMAGYHFDFTPDAKVSVFTGPELEVGFTGKLHLKSGNVSESGTIYDDGGMSRIDCLWRVGAGVTFGNYYGSVSGAFGLVNMNKNDGYTFHENLVSITLGYNF